MLVGDQGAGVRALESEQKLPNLFGRWSTARSYGPYGKSYASSSVDSDFESGVQSVGDEMPDEYWPYSEAENSQTDTIKSYLAKQFSDDLDLIDFEEDSIDEMIEFNNETQNALIDQNLESTAKNQFTRRFLNLIDNDQEVGEFVLENDGDPKLVDKNEGIYSIQKYKIMIPLTVRQVYKMTGFNGEIPSIETEAFPILKHSDGMKLSFIEAQTSKVETKTSFVTLGEKSLMILETSLIWTAEFEVTNIIRDIAIIAKIMGDSQIISQTKSIQQGKVEPTTKVVNYEEHFSNDGVSQGYLLSQASSAEKGNFDDQTDTYTEDFTNVCADIETDCESDWDESSVSDDRVSEYFGNSKLLLKAGELKKTQADVPEVFEKSEVEHQAENERLMTDVESICTLPDSMSNFELAAELKAAMSISNINEYNNCKASHSDISIYDSGFDSVLTQSTASMQHPLDGFDFNIIFEKAKALNAAYIF